MPRAGRFDQIVKLQREETVDRDFGEKTRSWVDVATLWAGIEEIKSSEPFKEDQLNSSVMVNIVIRHRPDVPLTGRFVHTDLYNVERIYQIKGQAPQNSGLGYKVLVFKCEMLHDPSPAIS